MSICARARSAETDREPSRDFGGTEDGGREARRRQHADCMSSAYIEQRWSRGIDKFTPTGPRSVVVCSSRSLGRQQPESGRALGTRRPVGDFATMNVDVSACVGYSEAIHMAQ